MTITAPKRLCLGAGNTRGTVVGAAVAIGSHGLGEVVSRRRLGDVAAGAPAAVGAFCAGLAGHGAGAFAGGDGGDGGGEGEKK